MKLLLLIAFGFVLFICIPVRVVVFNPVKTSKYSIRDLVLYVKHKQWNYAPVGFLNAYTGLFGMGKTLSAVEYCYDYYKKYNNKIVYDPYRNCYVTQLVNILSNVHLNIPYTEFTSLSQIVDIAEQVKDINENGDLRIVTLVFGDEFSVQMNSRNFKSNLDPLTLNAILTCRHHGISLIYTAQRFQHVDALLRQVTENVIECKKMWRVECLNYYDAKRLEDAGNSSQLKPRRRKGYFVTDEMFNQYDSISTVKNLIKDYKAGAMISEERILALQGTSDRNNEIVVNNRKRRRKKK